MENTTTKLNYFVCGGNDRERFAELCEKVFKEHEEYPELKMAIVIMEDK